MGWMCEAVPRELWKSRAFSMGLARFSKPLVSLTDRFVGETHAMRIDVQAEDGSTCTAVQSHESFRRVVGQSCAEFTAHLLSARGLLPAQDGAELPASGVFLPESLFESANARAALLERLLAVEGTIEYDFELCEAAAPVPTRI